MNSQVQYFKVQKQTARFRDGQKVFIRHLFPNYMWIRFKHRGNGRYVNGRISNHSKAVGDIKSIQVDSSFAKRITGEA